MNGRLLFTVIGITVLAIVAYAHLSDIYTFLELAAGIKPVSLDDRFIFNH